MDNIPKIIHIAWKHKHILDSQSPLILNGLLKLIDINQDWQVTIYNDEEIDEYLKVTLQEIDYKLIQIEKKISCIENVITTTKKYDTHGNREYSNIFIKLN